jgi:hypothetical protein
MEDAMCNAVSGWVHKTTYDVVLADPFSHAKTAGVTGINVDEHCEFEWERGKDLVVRTYNDEPLNRALLKAIRDKFPDREALVVAAKKAAKKHNIILITTSYEADQKYDDEKIALAVDLPDVVQLKKLRKCAEVFAPYAVSLSLPVLTTSGHIDARSATSISLPVLTTSGYIDARSATSISLPVLTTSGYIYAMSATKIDVPEQMKSKIRK